MKVGLCLGTEMPARLPMVERLGVLIEHTRMARKYGFDSVQVGQHYLHYPLQMLQPIPLLGRLAAESGDMDLGTCIMLLTLLHPVDVAEQIATLDTIAGGRLVFGVGLGYLEQEFHAFGVDKRQRVSRFEESLTLIKRLWTEDEVSFEGKHFNVRGLRPSHRPLRKPHPPIWIAANNDPAVRRAARMADAWYANPHATYQTVMNQMRVYRAALAEHGKPEPADVVLMREIYVAKDRKTAIEECRPGLGRRFDVYVEHGQDGEMPPGDDDFKMGFEDLIRDRLIVGSPDECAAELVRYAELGFNYIVLDFHWPGLPEELSIKNLKLIGEQVLPQLR